MELEFETDDEARPPSPRKCAHGPGLRLGSTRWPPDRWKASGPPGGESVPPRSHGVCALVTMPSSQESRLRLSLSGVRADTMPLSNIRLSEHTAVCTSEDPPPGLHVHCPCGRSVYRWALLPCMAGAMPMLTALPLPRAQDAAPPTEPDRGAEARRRVFPSLPPPRRRTLLHPLLFGGAHEPHPSAASHRLAAPRRGQYRK